VYRDDKGLLYENGSARVDPKKRIVGSADTHSDGRGQC
jgi:hypothetical protein